MSSYVEREKHDPSIKQSDLYLRVQNLHSVRQDIYQSRTSARNELTESKELEELREKEEEKQKN